MAVKVSGAPVINDDKSISVGNFSAATRPASPATGTLIYNTDDGQYESYNGSSWGAIGGGSSSSTDHPIFQQVYTQGDLAKVFRNPSIYSTGTGDAFGYAVDICGNYAIVGAYLEDDTGGTGSGAVYIFDVTTGFLAHSLTNPNAYGSTASDRFGEAVAISTNYAAVGASLEDASSGFSSGVVYIFDLPTGSLVHTIYNPNAYDTVDSDYFGVSVAISGDRLLVGANGEDDAGGSFSGVVYVFDIPTATLQHTLQNPNSYDTSSGDNFGYSVAVHGDYAIVGAESEDQPIQGNSGAAYIFNVSTGALVHTLLNPSIYSNATEDRFGIDVGISSNYAIVGAFREDQDGLPDAGAAYIFDVSTGALVHSLTNPNAYDTPEGDLFARSVAINDEYAVVGAYLEDGSGGVSSGAVYIFSTATGALVRTLTSPNIHGGSALDYFGWSVAVSENYVLTGAYGESDADGSTSGASYIFAVKDMTYLDKLYSLVL